MINIASLGDCPRIIYLNERMNLTNMMMLSSARKMKDSMLYYIKIRRLCKRSRRIKHDRYASYLSESYDFHCNVMVYFIHILEDDLITIAPPFTLITCQLAGEGTRAFTFPPIYSR